MGIQTLVIRILNLLIGTQTLKIRSSTLVIYLLSMLIDKLTLVISIETQVTCIPTHSIYTCMCIQTLVMNIY